MKDLNHYVGIYKKQLEKGDIQQAYAGLVKYMMSLSTSLSKKLSRSYTFGNLLQGYMDYTYVYYSNPFLAQKKLKMGLVLNHQKVQFEIWLLGRTVKDQSKYWQFFKDTKWNAGRSEMPKYSVLEAVAVADPDFNDLEALSRQIQHRLELITSKVLQDVKASQLH